MTSEVDETQKPDMEKLEKALEEGLETLKKNECLNEKAYVVYPYEWFSEYPAEEWVRASKEHWINIIFLKHGFTKREERYLLTEEGKLCRIYKKK